MKKRDKIIYWVATVWLALGMTASGIIQLMKTDEVLKSITSLGYPIYILNILGTWKILGAVALLVPNYPVVKEWAYAGFFFVASGALVSHIAVQHPFNEMAGTLLLLVLIIVSWYFRPVNRKTVSATQ